MPSMKEADRTAPPDTLPGTLIAVDWGTTNRRTYVIAPDGRCIDSAFDARGVISIPTGGFEAELDALRARFGDGPTVLAGMVGSNRGWKEVPYLPCPANFDALKNALYPVEEVNAVLVPGLSFIDGRRGDVMRGEELQILGAVQAGLCPADALVCHPGTHAKWARVKGGYLTGFRSVMTGEIFSLLRGHSILSPQLQGEVQTDADFAAGVETVLARGELTAELFAVRAGALLGLRPHEAASYVSGLLIGSDVQTGLGFAGDGEITLIGDPVLTELYAAALDIAGRRSCAIDGEQAFLAGARALAESLS